MNRPQYRPPWKVFLVLLIIVLILAYFVAGAFKIPGLSLSTLGQYLLEVFKHPFNNWYSNRTLPIMGLFFIFWMMFVGWYIYKFRGFRNDEYGSAVYADPEEINKELCDDDMKKNTILSKNVMISHKKMPANNNTLVIASSGDFKTTSYAEPQLLLANMNYVFTDIKGATQEKLGNYLKSKGYVIRSVNLKEPEKSDQINPFVNIHDEDGLLRLINAIHDSARPNKDQALEPFWDDAVDLYLQALFYYAWLDAKDRGKQASMADVIYLVKQESVILSGNKPGQTMTGFEKLINDKLDEYGPDYPPVRAYKALKDSPAKETSGTVILMIDAMLKLCNTAPVRRIFEGNDIDFKALALGGSDKDHPPMALFLVVPDLNNSYNFIFSMLLTQMFDEVGRVADLECNGQSLPVPLHVILDEFYNGVRPANTDNLLGTVRSRNIIISIILQSIAQAETLYPNGKADVLYDNFSKVAFLGSGPIATSTHRRFSEQLGKETINTKTDSESLGRSGSGNINYSRQGRELATLDELAYDLSPVEGIYFLKSHRPYLDEKAIPFDLPQYGFSANPEYKAMLDEATSFAPYEHPVEVYYDERNLRYITLSKEPEFKVIENPIEIEKYLKLAETNPNILNIDLDGKEIMYMNFNADHVPTDQIKAAIKEVAEAKNIDFSKVEGLSVFQDTSARVAVRSEQDERDMIRASWQEEEEIEMTIQKYLPLLTDAEEEDICIASALGADLEMLWQLMKMPTKERIRAIEALEQAAAQ